MHSLETSDDDKSKFLVKRYDALQAKIRMSERIGLCRGTEVFAVVSPMCARYLLEQYKTSIQPSNYLIAMIQCCNQSLLVHVYVDISIGIVKEKYDEKHVSRELYMNDNLLKQYDVTMRGVNSNSIYATIEKLVHPREVSCWKSVTLYPISPHVNLKYDYMSYCVKHYHYIQDNSIIYIPSTLYRNGTQTSDHFAYRVKCEKYNNNNSQWGYVDQFVTNIHLESYLSHLRSNYHDDPLVVVDEQEKSFENLVKFSLGLLHPNVSSYKIAPPRSFLLHGPRGVGKSTLVERVAARIGVKLIKISPSDIYAQSYEGEQGLAHLGTLYRRALEVSPVVWVIDELDILFHSNDDEKDKQLVDEFLSILENASYGVCIVGITSNMESLDSVIRRKFHEEVFIDVPSNTERLSLLRTHITKLQCDTELQVNLDKYLDTINMKCHGFVQADIKTIYKKLSERNTTVTFEDILATVKEHKPYSTKETSFSLTTAEIPQVKWEDIGGLHNIKQKLDEMIVWPMKYKDAYERMGIQPPKGLLLYGPPGTGKTMIAKAVASSANANFISINIPDLIKAEIGESEKTLAKIFRRAKLASPCVIFFDEIQAMFGDRDEVSHDQQKLISQLLLELDALEDNDESAKNPVSVILIAATNVPQNLDPSILRPGRVEHILYVAPPDPAARASIFEMTLKKMRVAHEVIDHIPDLVNRTDVYYTGADIVNICQQAGLNALCESIDIQNIRLSHFEQAMQSVQPSVNDQMIQFFQQWSSKVSE
jgi:transitional endoplasmic reticulum ATPase